MKKHLLSPVRILLLATLTAVPIVSQAADWTDKNGKRIYISEDFQAAQNAQSRASLEAYRKNAQGVSGPSEAGPLDLWLRELQAKEEARLKTEQEAKDKQLSEKRQQAEGERKQVQAALEERRRQEREDAQIVVVGGQFMTGKAARLNREAEADKAAWDKWASDKAAFDQVYGPIIRTFEAAREAQRNGTRLIVPADAEPIARALVSDYHQGQRLSGLNEVRGTEAELFAVGMDLYRQCDLTQASLTGIACTAAALSGRGRILVDRFLAECADRKNAANGPGNRGAYGYDKGWAVLACALATPDGKLDEDQRRLAAALLAEVINGRPVDDYPDFEEKTVAALLVAAACQAPELGQLPQMRLNYIPMVRKSIWTQGFQSYPAPVMGAVPLVPSALDAQVWLSLAIRLVLSDGSAYPGLWFAQVRAVLNGKTGFVLSATARQTLQQALDGWCNRAQASPWLRQALQADFDLTCAVLEGKIAENDPRAAELKALWYWDCLIRDHDETALVGERIKDLANEDPFHSGVTGFLLHAGAPAVERYITAVTTAVRGEPDGLATWTAIQELTNFRVAEGEKLPDLGISPAAWRRLVIAGEASRQLNARWQWNDPRRDEAPTMARIKRIRQDILGESADELKLPEYSREPADFVRSLLLLTEGGLIPEARPAVKKLLENKEGVTDPTTVWLIARILGMELGEWAQVGTWLDDDRRRPNDRSNPLYLPYLVAIIAREHATGYWHQKEFDPLAQPANDTERIMHEAIDELAVELADSEAYESYTDAQRRPFLFLRLLEPLSAEPGVRSLLAHAMVGAAQRIHSAALAYHTATGTDREYAMSGIVYPPTYRVIELAALTLDWKEISPDLRVVAANLLIDFTSDYSDKHGLFAVLDGLIAGESDRLADPVAYLAGQFTGQAAEEYASQRRALLRVAKLPRGSLQTAVPWDSIPSVAARDVLPPPEATLAATTAFESAAVGSPERAKLAETLVTVQLTADLENPFERSAEKALYSAASNHTDDGVAALAYATLIRREHNEIPWAYPPASRLVTDLRSLSAFSFREKENDWYTRSREANGFAALVLAYQKRVPGARTRLIELYDPVLGDETRFALGSETHSLLDDDSSGFAQIGTRARLAAVGTKDATSWLQRVTALPSAEDEAGLTALYVNAVRAHAQPEVITTELLRMVRQDTAGNAERAALHTLIADADAPRFFGSAWRDDSPTPFKSAWMLEILDQMAALEIPVPEDDFTQPLEAESEQLLASVPEGTDVPEEVMARLSMISLALGSHRAEYQEQKTRERMRRLDPKTKILLAFASTRTTSELARTIIHGAPYDFINSLVQIAAEEDPSLIPLLLRYNVSAAGLKPITAEHWALLAEGRLWPLPDGVREAE
ncbi:hypothetical protein Verru16b_02672 [Lacunisphaera limnophila]|uniref:Uncharacterized protein n=1 Tax=Lacunisphaera limnophila TaxID=1838286 RepID=A0A1D8AXG9_9BACT|nr:hypothetical protein [Lacunisphaera limnophila]AOS45589.1 hypothetical protein Verru16b_02672 [Lacunisphaera limnophila]